MVSVKKVWRWMVTDIHASDRLHPLPLLSCELLRHYKKECEIGSRAVMVLLQTKKKKMPVSAS